MKQRDDEVLGTASALLVAGVLLAAVILSAVAGFAFYAPQLGQLAGGQGATGADDSLTRPRDRARVEVAAYMAEGGEDRPTLAEVIEFFALEEDTWSCTVGENYGEAAQARASQYADRRLQVGDEIILCLD